jgi:hypothetical protein
VRLAAGPQFGTSSRNASRPWSGGGRSWRWGEDDEAEDGRPTSGDTYRTLCVRVCDGYYFPISFATGADRLERDRQVCASRCGAQGRLFVHANPGGAVEDMVDLAGQPYSRLRTAFLYRTEYVAGCKCQPHPWEPEARERHHGYALAAAARKGSRDAARELQALRERAQRERARQTLPPPPVPVEVARGRSAAAAPGKARTGDGEMGGLMRLGGERARGAASPPGLQRSPQLPSAPRDPDWVRRAFGAGGG